MKKQVFSIRLDESDARQLAALSAQHGLSQGELVRRSIRSHLGIVPPGVALAAALAEAPRPNADAPWLNGQGGADHDGWQEIHALPAPLSSPPDSCAVAAVLTRVAWLTGFFSG